MKLTCPNSTSHKTFLRESYDKAGKKVNVELMDEYARFIGDPLDLYSGDFTYRFLCAECREEAHEEG